MGRSKGGKKQKRKTKDMIVGSDVDNSSSSDEEETATSTEKPTAEEPAKAAQTGDAAPEAKPEQAKKADGKKAEGESTQSKDVGPVEINRHDPVDVTYCPICTFPAEMCEFSGMLEQCKPWLMENAAMLEAESIANAANSEEKGRKQKLKSDKEPKGEKVILFQTKVRARQKKTTFVQGLDAFGHNLKELCQMFKKKFSCGCSIEENPGVPDAIEIQGEVVDEVAELIQGGKFNIPKELMFRVGKGNSRTPLFE